MRAFAILLLGAALLGGLPACRPNYAELPTFSAERKLLQVVVEMPAGTNHEQRYDPATKEFRPLQQAGSDQLVEFLPFPGNFGFIPGTRLPGADSTGQRPLAAVVLSESQPAGTVQEVLPVALLALDNDGTLEQVVLAVPARPAQRILPDVTDWAALTRRYPAVRSSLSLWFQHRGRPGATRIVGWKDERDAEKRVRALMK